MGFLSAVDLPFHGDTENDLSVCGKGEGGTFLKEGRDRLEERVRNRIVEG